MASKKFNLILVCLIASIFCVMGCGSKSSNPTAPPYAQPPEPPTGLNATFFAATMSVTLYWNESSSAVHAGYLIERRNEDESERTILVNAPQSATVFIDDNDIDFGSKLYYYVYTVDTRNNRSAEAIEIVRIEYPEINSAPGFVNEPLGD